jgi:hypothetical protein
LGLISRNDVFPHQIKIESGTIFLHHFPVSIRYIWTIKEWIKTISGTKNVFYQDRNSVFCRLRELARPNFRARNL